VVVDGFKPPLKTRANNQSIAGPIAIDLDGFNSPARGCVTIPIDVQQGATGAQHGNTPSPIS
tara:strand:+ start:59 stop:244 length:186 start_codon:yes stop_codon:yes gene_type:complete